MNITIHSGNWEELEIDALAIPMVADQMPNDVLDGRVEGLLTELIAVSYTHLTLPTNREV